VVDGKKISGNAQAWYKNKMLHHGTILFDADLEFVVKVLNVKQDKIESKGIKSNKARVTNIKTYLKDEIDIISFKQKLLSYLLNSGDVLKNIYPLSNDDLVTINEIRSKRYMDWNWNYGESPDSQVFKERRFTGGKLQLYFDIKKGTISNLKIYGDFLNSHELEPLLNLIENSVYEKSYIMKAIEKVDFNNFFLNISKEEFIDCLIG